LQELTKKQQKTLTDCHSELVSESLKRYTIFKNNLNLLLNPKVTKDLGGANFSWVSLGISRSTDYSCSP